MFQASVPGGAGVVSLTSAATDKPGVLLLQPQGLAEVSTTRTYTYQMVLTAPVASGDYVKVSLIDNGQTTPSQSSVTFDSTNWNTPVSITLSYNSAYKSTSAVAQTVTSSDPNYANVSAPSVNVAVLGSGVALNNQPNPTVLPSGLVIDQGTQPTTIVAGETTFSYKLSLSKAPAYNETVYVNLTGPNEGALPAGVSLSQSTLAFDWSDWSNPQTVTVSSSLTGVHGAQGVDVEQSIVSSDPWYSW